MNYTVGSLVRARGREWIVLPDSSGDALLLRPLGGSEMEVTGILPALEDVQPASFPPPDPTQSGPAASASMLRDAARLGFRAAAGPFRSFGRLAFDPRPYQLVPLMMALRQDVVRLLVADDVGIGKTIEALLIARELFDRGEIERMAVLCPPPLAEQWQREMAEKFNLDAELVLPGTVARLERGLGLGESLFDRHPFTIISTDYIKSDRRRDEFLRACPEFVIVDEAHTCAFSDNLRGGHKQRYELVRGLADDPERHLVLVTATPHSGKEQAFRSLLTFLDEALEELPEDLSGTDHAHHRRELSRFLVQRRRGDVRSYLKSETPFPDRDDREEAYHLSEPYRDLFDRVLAYTRTMVLDESGKSFHQRVRWWSALALLRSLASSPAAAAATLRTRAAAASVPEEKPEEADRAGERTVLDMMLEEGAGDSDVIPGSDYSEEDDEERRHHRRLLAFARDADALHGDQDAKLIRAVELMEGLLEEGYSPIVFCRFIPTAEYVAQAMRDRLGSKKGFKDLDVLAVTGTMTPQEREERIAAVDRGSLRILVATDCLSEGINLQDAFDAVMHYDLSWNPTRHEQREGRVDRFGQRREKVAVLTYYGIDNRIDGVVLDVLIRKHKQIRSSLGISVPVPANTNEVVQAIFEGLLMRSGDIATGSQILPGFEDYMRPQREALYDEWDRTKEREKRSRTMFAQERLKPDVVAAALREAQRSAGSMEDVQHFVLDALKASGASLESDNGVFHTLLDEAHLPVRELFARNGGASFTFEVGQKQGVYLTRTHPLVEELAAYVLDNSLDPAGDALAARSGVIRTGAVSRKTALYMLRVRYHLRTLRKGEENLMLVEDLILPAAEGSGDARRWLGADEVERLLGAAPDANVSHQQRTEFLEAELAGLDARMQALQELAHQHGERVLEAHREVRHVMKIGGRVSITSHDPPDLLGLYLFLPAPGGGRG